MEPVDLLASGTDRWRTTSPTKEASDVTIPIIVLQLAFNNFLPDVVRFTVDDLDVNTGEFLILGNLVATFEITHTCTSADLICGAIAVYSKTNKKYPNWKRKIKTHSSSVAA
ncbi:unnamed protein product, partial [Ceratitis capitata]